MSTVTSLLLSVGHARHDHSLLRREPAEDQPRWLKLCADSTGCADFVDAAGGSSIQQCVRRGGWNPKARSGTTSSAKKMSPFKKEAVACVTLSGMPAVVMGMQAVATVATTNQQPCVPWGS